MTPSNQVKIKNGLLLMLQVAVVAVFLGRAWQHIIWDAPYRSLLWDEGLMKGFIENVFGMPWQSYITSPEVDDQIQGLIKGTGWFYLICALMAIMIRRWRRVAGVFMIIGSISLVFLAMLYCKERFFSLGQFFEYSLQFSSPLLLYLIVKKERLSPRLILYIKLAIALTFVCHGLYAVAYYPRPGYFTEMTMAILGIEESTAIQFLNLAGILDFVIGIGVFLPFRISKWILLYAVFWGFMTTIARVWAYVEIDYFWETIKQWGHESIYRIPHFLIPLYLYLQQMYSFKFKSDERRM